jgi:hypothetical protein
MAPSTPAPTSGPRRGLHGDMRAVEKIVYSRTLTTVSSVRAQLEREFDREAIRWMKAPGERDLSVGGPELTGQAI